MSTITKERVAQFINNPLDNGLTRGEQMELARIALASLESKAIGYIDAEYAELLKSGHIESCSVHAEAGEGCITLYAAPPAPVSVHDERYQNLSELYHAQENRLFKLAQRIKGPSFDKYAHSPSQAIDVLESAIFGERADDACHAAMLQGMEPVSNRDELPLDYLQGHKDGLEWAALLAEANHPQTGDWLYDDPVELAKAIRKGPDMPESRRGNSPVIPDGWQLVPKKITIEMECALSRADSYEIGWQWALAAAPQQEVK